MQPNTVNSQVEELPFEVVQKKILPSYIFRLPVNPKMCYRFCISKVRAFHFSLLCQGCLNSYNNKKQEKQDISHPTTLKAHGCSMESDPSLGHIEGCEPLLYSETIRTYIPVKEEKSKKSDNYDYKLEKAVKIAVYFIIHRLKDNPDLCYRFSYLAASRTRGISVGCVPCHSLARKIEKTKCCHYRLTNGGFADDPSLHHLPGCSPITYEKLLQNYEIVDEDTSKEVLSAWNRGTFTTTAVSLPPKDNNSEAPGIEDTGYGVVQLKQHMFFLYRVPGSDECIIFSVQKNGRRYLTVSCKFCLYLRNCEYRAQRKPPNVLPRKNDGFSMKEDPLLNHMPGCKRDVFGEVMKKYSNVDEGTHHQGMYEFPLVKIRVHGNMQVIFRLKDDSSKCYLFDYSNKSTDTGIVVSCSGCTMDHKQFSGKRRMQLHRINRLGFLDDPLGGHHEDCAPFIYDEVMKNKEFVEKSTADNFLAGSFQIISENLLAFRIFFLICRNITRANRIPGIRAPKRRHATITYEPISNEFEKDGSTEIQMDNTLSPAPSSSIHISNDSSKELDVSSDTNSNMAPVFANSENSADGNVKEAKTEPVDSKFEIPLIISVAKSKIFLRVYDVPFFEEDEAEIMIINRKIVLQFERKSQTVGVEGCFLSYSIDVPASIDISTVTTTWNQGKITLTAERNS